VTTSGALTNNGDISLDTYSQGGSLLTIGGTLTNSGVIEIGAIGNTHSAPSTVTIGGTLTNSGIIAIDAIGNTLSAPATVRAASLENIGSIFLAGSPTAEGVDAILHTGGAFTNDGSVNLSNDILSNNDKIAGPVSGTGNFSLSAQSTLNFASSVSSGETVTFDSTPDKLILGQPSSFDGTIDDFTKGDTVVAKGFAAAQTMLTYAPTGADSCSLTLTDGANKAVLNFAGEPYTRSDFALLPWYGGAGSAIRFV
jgi:hypothetical protein